MRTAGAAGAFTRVASRLDVDRQLLPRVPGRNAFNHRLLRHLTMQNSPCAAFTRTESHKRANFALELTHGPFLGAGKGNNPGGTAAALRSLRGTRQSRRPPRRGEAGAECPRA